MIDVLRRCNYKVSYVVLQTMTGEEIQEVHVECSPFMFTDMINNLRMLLGKGDLSFTPYSSECIIVIKKEYAKAGIY